MNEQEKQDLIKEIKKKKEYSSIPDSEVEKILDIFDKEKYAEKEKFKLTREMLMKLFSGTMSKKLLSPKILEKKSGDEVLKKHLSTRERFENYEEIYSMIFNSLDLNRDKEVSVIDLGAGINGLSYNKFPEDYDVNYVGIEIVGRLVDLMNEYFKKQGLLEEGKEGKAKAIQESLFNLRAVEKIIKNTEKPRVIFLFKILDSLEFRERDYTKKLLLELKNMEGGIQGFVLSFSTESFIKKEKFKAKRKWIQNFLKENFQEVENFGLGGERYVVFK